MNYNWSELDNAIDIRNEFVRNFVNTNMPLFNDHIIQIKNDGYSGFLWEFLHNPSVIDEKDAFSHIEKKPLVLFFFDNWHSYKSKTYVFPEKTWKHTVYKSSGVVLLDIMLNYCFVGLEHQEKDIEPIPDEVYIFDETYNWYIVLTKENLPNGERLCFSKGLNRLECFNP